MENINVKANRKEEHLGFMPLPCQIRQLIELGFRDILLLYRTDKNHDV